MTLDAQYEADVEAWALGALSRSNPTWPEFLRTLPGVYPSNALRTLERLAARESLDPTDREAVRSIMAGAAPVGASPPHQPWRTGGRPLAVPHPLDFEWRFTPESADLLIGRCVESVLNAHPIALVGAPTVLIRAAERSVGHRFVLYDKNRATISRLLDVYPRTQVFVHDACVDAPPGFVAGATVLDPPWYDPYVRGFLWTASRLTRPGGPVLLSLPPEGTRPGIAAERASLFEWAMGIGLDLVDFERGCLAYVSPPFEWNALQAGGVGNCPPDWRRGDLVTFRVHQKVPDAPRPSVPPEAERWAEVEARGVRVRFDPRTRRQLSVSSLDPVVEGDILSSVSARDPRRGAASVWTSGNRIFACDDPLRLRAELQALLRARDGDDPAGLATSGEAAQRLLGVILREEREYAACDA